MKKIKFSHDYEKIPENWKGTQAVLIGVQYTSYLQSFLKRVPQLRNYDTTFRNSKNQYPIEFDEAIILFFIHLNTSKIFTTIRRYTSEKLKYYEESVFKTFELVEA